HATARAGPGFSKDIPSPGSNRYDRRLMTTTSHGAIISRLRTVLTVSIITLALGCSGDDSSTPRTPTSPTTTVTALALTGASTLTSPGATTQFTAVATLSDGTTEDRTSTAMWQSENTGVATVSPQGVVQAVANGSTSIAAVIGEV